MKQVLTDGETLLQVAAAIGNYRGWFE